MAVRIRENGSIFCATLSEPEEGDTYLNDGISYELSVVQKALVTTKNGYHMKNGGEWWWKGSEPDNVIIDEFYYRE